MKTDASPEANAVCGLSHVFDLSADGAGTCVYLVHGRAGNRGVMWAFRRILPEGISIIAPEAPLADPIGGFSWWQIGEKEAMRAEREVSIRRLEAFIGQAEDLYGLRPARRVALGFSQGAAMLSLLMQRNCSLFSAVGLLSGFVVEDSVTLAGRLPSVFIFHGSNDETVTIDRAYRGRDYLMQKGAEVTFCEEPVGHKVGVAGMRALKDWITKEIS